MYQIASKQAEASPGLVPQPIIENRDGSFDVLSSDHSRYYTVRVKGNRCTSCTCKAGRFRKPCHHIREVKEFAPSLRGQVFVITEPAAQLSLVRHRYLVEMVSDAVDEEGIPLEVKTVDVLVSQPGKEAIAPLLSATDWLKGFTMVDFLRLSDCTEF